MQFNGYLRCTSDVAGKAGANGIKKKSVVLDDNLGQPTLIVKSLVIF